MEVLVEPSFKCRSQLVDLQASISGDCASSGRRPDCAAHSQDAAGGNGACNRLAFRRPPSGADKHPESNRGVESANSDWTDASVPSDKRTDHKSSVGL